MDEALGLAYRDRAAIPLLIGSDLPEVLGAAAHLSQLPALPEGARVLDVGGGPGHLALWMLQCWPAASVTVLDTLASSVALDWTPALETARIEFVDGDIFGDLSAVAERRFERVVVARTIGQGHHESNLDLRPRFLDAMVALKPLVAPGGDLVVIDHFHGRDTEMADALKDQALAAGFGTNVKGWRLSGGGACLPWQLRFVNDADSDG
jgi:ubiquinone/menaquinone biosynthesis C-methylase UbiE